MEVLYDPVLSLLTIFPKTIKSACHKDTLIHAYQGNIPSSQAMEVAHEQRKGYTVFTPFVSNKLVYWHIRLKEIFFLIPFNIIVF